MKKVFALAVVLAIAASAAAMAEGTKEGAAAAPTELTVWMGSWWNEKAPLIVKEFEKIYPKYALKPDLLPINGYVDNAVAAILAGSPPDVLDIDFTQIAPFVGKSLLTDITADVEPSASTITEAAIARNTAAALIAGFTAFSSSVLSFPSPLPGLPEPDVCEAAIP